VRRLALAAAVGLLVSACGDDGARNLPAISIAALGEGDVLDVGELDGPAVVNFWATWCQPCLRELPDFQRASEDFPDVRFVGVDATGFGETTESIDFLADLGVTYEQYVDTDGELSAELDITEMPATLIVDGEGEVSWFRQGQVSYDQLAERLAEL
jgi:cytochrome c biogenesis protein CcmG, thiol:disulfide interchange protein DsbE